MAKTKWFIPKHDVIVGKHHLEAWDEMKFYKHGDVLLLQEDGRFTKYTGICIVNFEIDMDDLIEVVPGTNKPIHMAYLMEGIHLLFNQNPHNMFKAEDVLSLHQFENAIMEGV